MRIVRKESFLKTIKSRQTQPLREAEPEECNDSIQNCIIMPNGSSFTPLIPASQFASMNDSHDQNAIGEENQLIVKSPNQPEATDLESKLSRRATNASRSLNEHDCPERIDDYHRSSCPDMSTGYSFRIAILSAWTSEERATIKAQYRTAYLSWTVVAIIIFNLFFAVSLQKIL